MKKLLFLGSVGFVTAASAQSTNGWAADIVADTTSLWAMIVPLVVLIVMLGIAIRLVKKFVK